METGRSQGLTPTSILDISIVNLMILMLLGTGVIVSLDSLIMWYAILINGIKLFHSFCTSMYGCELWSLADRVIDEICVAWRKSLRRGLNFLMIVTVICCHRCPVRCLFLLRFASVQHALFLPVWIVCLNSRSILVQSVKLLRMVSTLLAVNGVLGEMLYLVVINLDGNYMILLQTMFR
jgi:hypothetical protein